MKPNPPDLASLVLSIPKKAFFGYFPFEKQSKIGRGFPSDSAPKIWGEGKGRISRFCVKTGSRDLGKDSG